MISLGKYLEDVGNATQMKKCLLLIGVSFILLFPDMFAQQQSSSGYKGIWFTLGQFSEYGDKYSGGLGTYTAKHIPMALFSAKANQYETDMFKIIIKHPKEMIILNIKGSIHRQEKIK